MVGEHYKELQPGDRATTRYNGPMATVEITDRRECGGCQSGVMYRVAPNLRNGTAESWYDAAWFTPKENP